MRFTMTRHVSMLKPSVFMSFPAKDRNTDSSVWRVGCIQCKQKRQQERLRFAMILFKMVWSSVAEISMSWREQAKVECCVFKVI